MFTSRGRRARARAGPVRIVLVRLLAEERPGGERRRRLLCAGGQRSGQYDRGAAAHIYPSKPIIIYHHGSWSEQEVVMGAQTISLGMYI